MGNCYQKKTRPEKGKAASTLLNGTSLHSELSRKRSDATVRLCHTVRKPSASE